MQVPQSIVTLLGRLWRHLSQRRHRQFGLLLLLMVMASFAEILSIGAVLPFLAVFSAPDRLYSHPVLQPVIEVLGLTAPDQLVLPLTIAFGIAALMSGALRLLLLWLSTRFSFATGADLSIAIYRRTLYQPYAVHVSRNSSEVINGIARKADGVIYGIIGPSLTVISSGMLLVAILVALLYVDPFISLTAFVGFGVIYGSIIRITRTRKIRNSQCIARESTQVIKSLQEGLGGIRDVLIDGSQSVYCDIYRSADIALRHAQGSNLFISQGPRYAVEALGMVLIAGLAFTLSQQEGGVTRAIPVLGALALGAQRMLPVMQQAYAAWSSIVGGQASLADTLVLLDQPLPAYADCPQGEAIPFRHGIRFNQLGFRYSQETQWILKNVSLEIPKGARVGFIGSTGSGKSTLLDIVMGLLQPTEGEFAVDEQRITKDNKRAWQAHIAHVPQTIFLADTSIEENIAFGQPIDRINHEQVRQAAHSAQISDIIEAWPEGYRTFVGERGIRLSGGQRQRIGIARALYKQADVIVFDEATSALDNATEQAVMESIEGLGGELTILIIAHRLTTLRNCTLIVELGDAGIQRVGSYQDIVAPRL